MVSHHAHKAQARKTNSRKRPADNGTWQRLSSGCPHMAPVQTILIVVGYVVLVVLVPLGDGFDFPEDLITAGVMGLMTIVLVFALAPRGTLLDNEADEIDAAWRDSLPDVQKRLRDDEQEQK